MAYDHHHLFVDDDRLAKAELGDRRLHRVDGRGVVAGIAGIGDQLLDRHVGDDHGVLREKSGKVTSSRSGRREIKTDGRRNGVGEHAVEPHAARHKAG